MQSPTLTELTAVINYKMAEEVNYHYTEESIESICKNNKNSIMGWYDTWQFKEALCNV